MRALLILISFFLSTTAAQAQSDFFPFKRGPNGEILAPFADVESDLKDQKNPLMNLYDPLGGTPENSSKIDTPHRSKGQLAQWAADIVVRATTLATTDAQKALQDIRPLFTEAGWQSYRGFLRAENITSSLESGRGFRISSFSKQEPELLGQGVAKDGAYKWVYDVPITLDRNGTTEDINIVVQITRVADVENSEHDVKIEVWRVDRLTDQSTKNGG